MTLSGDQVRAAAGVRSLESSGSLTGEGGAASIDQLGRFPDGSRPARALRRSRALRGDNRGYALRRWLAGSDLVALPLSWVIALGADRVLAGRNPILADTFVFLLLLPLWTYIASLLRLYHLPQGRLDYSVADEIGAIALSATVWSWVFLVTRATVESGPIPVLPSVSLWVAMILTVPALRALTRYRARGRSWYRQRVTILGMHPDLGRVVRRIRRHPEYGLDVVRKVEIDWRRDPGDGSPASASRSTVELVASAVTDRDGIPTIRAAVEPDDLAEIATFSRIDRVVIASPLGDLEERSQLIRRLADASVHVDIVSGDTDVFSSGTVLHYVEGLPLLTIPAVPAVKAWAVLKRLFDVVMAGVCLAALSPLLAYCAIRIKFDSGGPLLFRQQRIGRHDRPFTFLKFRTMVEDADARKAEVAALNIHSETPGMFKVPGDPRITKVGCWLRRWSLDELPQLWNVLKGDMSLVGPRPLIPEEAERVSGDYTERQRMRPGITGPWQTLGRSEIGFADMVKLDYTYVINWSFAEDIRLLLRTIGAVAEGRGAY